MEYLLGISITITAGYIIGRIIQLIKVPSVAGYVLIGLVLGNSCLGIIGPNFIENTSVISDIALGFIAFTIGGELIMKTLKRIGARVFVIAFLEAISAFILVTGGMLLMNQSLALALLLGAVASATAPAATLMVISELKAEGPLTSTLLAVVAIDDAICLMIYAVASSVAKVLVISESGIHWAEVILGPLVEISGSILVGSILGFILVLLLKLSRDKSEILIVVIAAILAATGLANQLGLSPLLTNMTLGVVISNFSREQLRAFYVIESISSPIYVAFFVIAGSRLQLNMLVSVGTIGLVYILARAMGKIGGASLGAVITHADPSVKKYVGFGLISQIGVAVGLAIVINHEFAGSAIGDTVITVLLATTIVTEIVGPLMTRVALIGSKEAAGIEGKREKMKVKIREKNRGIHNKHNKSRHKAGAHASA
jgi:Kef-type K+ transport system membrane component KefB